MAETERRAPSKESRFTDVGKQTWKHLTEVQRFGYSRSQVFRDFVDTALYSLLSLTYNMRFPDLSERLRQNKLEGPYEEQYLKVVARYRENKDRPRGQRPADYFASAWGALQHETAEYEHDILGEIYMREISHGEHGQFFTPVQVCDLMAHMTGTVEGEAVNDPACGSGRFFISTSKVNPNLSYVGIDLSDICAKMSVLNMWLFNLNADIYCGNSLSQEMSRRWRVRKGGYVYEDEVDRLPTPQPSEAPSLPPEPAQSVVEPTSDEPGQQTLFDLTEFTEKKQRRLRSE
jgi:N-6 DNA Methylase